MTQTLYWETFDSPLGKMMVCCSDRGLLELSLGSRKKLRTSRNGSHRPQANSGKQWLRADGQSKKNGARLVRRVVAELNEYVAGRRKQFTVPLDLYGTPFQMKVWRALLRIPYGETRSYQQIARAGGQPSRFPRRGHGKSLQPGGDHRSLPPRHSQRRITRRLCRGPEKKNPDTADGTSGARRFSSKINLKWSIIS